jgi:D-alanine transaminase
MPKAEQSQGIKAVAIPDIRWKYCQIKTTARLAYILMFQQAKEAGADEAIIIHKGFALEGTLSNLFMVKNNVIITPPKSTFLLSGITRDRILTLAQKHQLPCREEKIAEQDLSTADELWITSSTKGVIPILTFNDKPVGKGKAGPVWNKMWDYYNEDMADCV